MEQKWITDRLPTAADGDIDGDVRMRPPGSDRSWIVHWSFVCRGMDWLHTGLWEPPAQPASTEPDRITALEQRVAELEAFYRQLITNLRLVVEPRQ